MKRRKGSTRVAARRPERGEHPPNAAGTSRSPQPIPGVVSGQLAAEGEAACPQEGSGQDWERGQWTNVVPREMAPTTRSRDMR